MRIKFKSMAHASVASGAVLLLAEMPVLAMVLSMTYRHSVPGFMGNEIAIYLVVAFIGQAAPTLAVFGVAFAWMGKKKYPEVADAGIWLNIGVLAIAAIVFVYFVTRIR
jgi:hypothetical protein